METDENTVPKLDDFGSRISTTESSYLDKPIYCSNTKIERSSKFLRYETGHGNY